MTKRQRPWGDSEEDQCRLRKSHQSQKDLDKRSESAMQVVHTKTLDMLFQGARKLNDKGQAHHMFSRFLNLRTYDSFHEILFICFSTRQTFSFEIKYVDRYISVLYTRYGL